MTKASGVHTPDAHRVPSTDQLDRLRAQTPMYDAVIEEVDGRRISHTMDPRNGVPVRNALASVTVVSPRCMDADAYATALTVLGEGAGRTLAQRLGLDALFVVRDGDALRASGTGVFDDA